MDLWVWIAIFIVAWLLEALAGAAKKRQQQQRAPRPPAQQRSAPRAPTASQPARPAGRQAPAAKPAQRRPMRPTPQEPPPIVVRLPESSPWLEGISAEVDVETPTAEATEAAHTRAVAKHRAAVPGEIGGPEAPRRQLRFRLNPGTLRQAVVWREILGPPRSER